jgi:hypothetical protein
MNEEVQKVFARYLLQSSKHLRTNYKYDKVDKKPLENNIIYFSATYKMVHYADFEPTPYILIEC